MAYPAIFIGSSREQIGIVDKIVAGLREVAVARPWHEIFSASDITLPRLVETANEVDFAMFVFGPDDWTESRETRLASPRDNVVYEAGLFCGVLGINRTFIFAANVKLPSDLLGLTPITYDPAKDIEREIELGCLALGKAIAKRGWRGSEGLAGQLNGAWWQYVLSDAENVEQSAIALIRIERLAPRLVRLSGDTWTREGDRVAQFESRAASLDEEDRSLFYYWEGNWPGRPNDPEPYGTGEIKLQGPGRAKGWFTVRSDNPDGPQVKLQAAYFRATPEEAAALDGDPAARRALITEQLEKRQGMLFTG